MKRLIRITTITASVLLCIAHNAIPQVTCESGCYSYWTATVFEDDCLVFDPYTCAEGPNLRVDLSECGECVEVAQGVTDPTYEMKLCDEEVCEPVCNNCGPTHDCLYYPATEYFCVTVSMDVREECTGSCPDP